MRSPIVGSGDFPRGRGWTSPPEKPPVAAWFWRDAMVAILVPLLLREQGSGLNTLWERGKKKPSSMLSARRVCSICFSQLTCRWKPWVLLMEQRSTFPRVDPLFVREEQLSPFSLALLVFCIFLDYELIRCMEPFICVTLNHFVNFSCCCSWKAAYNDNNEQ